MDNGKIAYRNRYRYNYILANVERLQVLSFLKEGPRPWMETYDHLHNSRIQKGNFARLLQEMQEDLLIRMEYDPKGIDQTGRSQGITIVRATHFGLEKMRQTIEEIESLK